jgi:hypothetical protein
MSEKKNYTIHSIVPLMLRKLAEGSCADDDSIQVLKHAV